MGKAGAGEPGSKSQTEGVPGGTAPTGINPKRKSDPRLVWRGFSFIREFWFLVSSVLVNAAFPVASGNHETRDKETRNVSL